MKRIKTETICSTKKFIEQKEHYKNLNSGNNQLLKLAFRYFTIDFYLHETGNRSLISFFASLSLLPWSYSHSYRNRYDGVDKVICEGAVIVTSVGNNPTNRILQVRAVRIFPNGQEVDNRRLDHLRVNYLGNAIAPVIIWKKGIRLTFREMCKYDQHQIRSILEMI